MKILARVFVGWLALAATLAAQPLRSGSPAAARVIILANSADPDSLRLAAHYAAARGVPADNLIALRLPLEETISWPDFINTLWQPLQDELVRRGWIEAIDTKIRDGIGRKKYAVVGHRLAYLVVCRGVPLRIAAEKNVAEKPTPFSSQPLFQTNQAAVDSELSLLAQSSHPINGWLPNPLFHTEYPTPFELSAIVKVGRLDGPTLADAERLVDNALVAERTGLIGRSYIDKSGKNPEGDEWLDAAAAQLAALGFDGDVDRAPATLPVTARCDAPAIYFGWYAGNLNGPFTLPNFTFPPGAIALHIHSFSAETLRSATQGWCGPLVARGVTATMGNVYEPYLEFTHHPDLLLHALVRGWTLGDAAYYSLPALSWQAVLIGDPLYRPFAIDFERQWKNLKNLPPALAPYVVLRRMRLLDTQGRSEAAIAAGRATMDESPSLVLGMALAERLAGTGDAKGAAREIEFVRLLKEFHPEDWALAAEAARLLLAGGRAQEAVEVWKNLFTSASLPAGASSAWLGAARDAALAAHDSAQAAVWEEQLAEPKPEGK